VTVVTAGGGVETTVLIIVEAGWVTIDVAVTLCSELTITVCWTICVAVDGDGTNATTVLVVELVDGG